MMSSELGSGIFRYPDGDLMGVPWISMVASAVGDVNFGRRMC